MLSVKTSNCVPFFFGGGEPFGFPDRKGKNVGKNISTYQLPSGVVRVVRGGGRPGPQVDGGPARGPRAYLKL